MAGGVSIGTNRVILLRAAAFTLLLCGLVSCGSKEPVTLTYLSPEWSQSDERPRAQKLAQLFTKQTGIGVRHLPIPESAGGQLEISRKLLHEQGLGPDVVAIDVVWPGALADHLADLGPYLAKEISELDPKLVAAYTVDGKVVAIPYHSQVGVLAYRADLLKKYGFDHPPKTWNELEQMAARIQAAERAAGRADFWGYVWQGAGEGLTCNAIEWQVSEGGGKIIEDDGTISVNNAAAIRSWERARHWLGWISPPSVIAYHELDSLNLFDSGLVAFRRTWLWRARLTQWQGAPAAEKPGFAGMPGGPGGRFGALGGIGLAVSQQSRHPQEAIELVRFLIREELDSRDENNAKTVPEHFDLPSLLEPPGRMDEPRASTVVSRPSAVAKNSYEQVTKSYFDSVHSVLTGETPAPKAAAELEKKLTQTTGLKAGTPKTGTIPSSAGP